MKIDIDKCYRSMASKTKPQFVVPLKRSASHVSNRSNSGKQCSDSTEEESSQVKGSSKLEKSNNNPSKIVGKHNGEIVRPVYDYQYYDLGKRKQIIPCFKIPENSFLIDHSGSEEEEDLSAIVTVCKINDAGRSDIDANTVVGNDIVYGEEKNVQDVLKGVNSSSAVICSSMTTFEVIEEETVSSSVVDEIMNESLDTDDDQGVMEADIIERDTIVDKEATSENTNIDKKFSCTCGLKFSRIGWLDRHMIQCIGVKKCDICGNTFKSGKTLKKHKQSVHVGCLNCDVCDESFSSRFDLKKHLTVAHGSKVTCQICGSTFKNKNSLRQHNNKIHRGMRYDRTKDEMKQFKCLECDKVYENPSGLRKHKKKHNKSHLKISTAKLPCDKAPFKDTHMKDSSTDENADVNEKGEDVICFEGLVDVIHTNENVDIILIDESGNQIPVLDFNVIV